ncbi:molybdopterin molybdotransferase MoeA [Limibaculum sp. M0105]|uniref:Molybdopterin molybdenumtransferase n=1 Tax=Thermohalobaculum xanthum TaxID=2753746 RepID=A0A8J7SCT1_9RHOB|nr:gephyrin-like molybdotransferase Glp [Thermohalobaculum xanthum]MBK0398818.1 molybdopterin molybdotransferase MoeA [Thermohalobaculum xanthum]
MIPVADALARLLALVEPLPGETVPLAEAGGRVMLDDAVATRDQPPFDASAMDGYAVRAAEAVTGADLEVAGQSAAGRAFGGALPRGGAVRIFTGAPVPEGADAILIQEDAERQGSRVRVVTPPGRGEYVRPRGMDFPAGFRLPGPRRLAARDVALLAAMNLPTVTVARRPVVALIPTGDELVEPGETPGADQIVSSNNYGLATMLAAIGAVPRMCPIARDTRASLVAALEVARGADFIVTLGGASVGDHDLVAEVFGAEGLALDFFKVAMRPGKPLMAGRIGGSVMLGLPGNPVSSMICGEIFLRPAIDRALGLPARARPRRRGRIEAAIEANGPREHYMRAVMREGADGVALLSTLSRQDSNLLATLAEANALIVRAPHSPAAAQGEAVEFIALD